MSTSKTKFFDIGDKEIISLAAIEEIGAVTWNKVYAKFGSLSSFLGNINKLQGILSEKQIDALKNRKNLPDLPKQIKLIKIANEEYPKLLKEITDPPLWLFVVGDTTALDGNCLAVVGSRKHTAYANSSIYTLLSGDILKNVTIVSGLAYGIDKLAHQASLKQNGKTVAVLAGGLDNIYPSTHRNLAKEIIKKGGALISEYPPGSPAIAYKFPIRNRIISGLSQATIVVEAAIKSGTMTTAKSVIDQNRELFVIPGDINKKTSEGCNYLIAQGATPLIYKEQLMNFYGIKKGTGRFDLKDETDVNLFSQQSKGSALSALIERGSAVTVDELAKSTGQSVEPILQELTVLELSGKVYQEKPGHYKIDKNG